MNRKKNQKLAKMKNKKSSNPKNQFEVGGKYNAMQTMSLSVLSNNHAPIHYVGLIFEETEVDENGVMEHRFSFNGDTRWFDDDFTNTGNSFDNSMIIIESLNTK